MWTVCACKCTNKILGLNRLKCLCSQKKKECIQVKDVDFLANAGNIVVPGPPFFLCHCGRNKCYTNSRANFPMLSLLMADS